VMQAASNCMIRGSIFTEQQLAVCLFNAGA